MSGGFISILHSASWHPGSQEETLKLTDMNYTEDQITKAIAPYIGQKIINKYNPTHDGQVLNRNTMGAFLWFNGKLLLLPLSAITEEDACKVAMLAADENIKGSCKITTRTDRSIQMLTSSGIEVEIDIQYSAVEIYIEDEFQSPHNQSQIIDLLRSKGYDLPSYHLGGKTLIEAGLAIDATKEEVKE